MIPLAIPSLNGNEAQYLQECITTGFVSSVGAFVDRFEALVAEAAGCAQAVATSAGTTGLHAALAAVDVAPGDLVIIPSLTFIATANAVAQTGATPWLMDVTRESWTLDPALLEHELSHATQTQGGALIHRATGRRVAAIVPVHTLGLPADMDPITDTARRYGLPVVADAAAALGATYRGRAVGKLGADLSVFSFNGNKTLTAGGGGAVVGDDASLVKLVRHLTTTARVGEDYDHDRAGFNYRMTNLQAAVGCAQMERLDALVNAKRAIDAGYRRELAGLGLDFFPKPDWAESACWFTGICVDDRTDWIARLRAKGIGARSFWKPMHLQAPFVDSPRTAMPVSDSVWGRVLTLPCSTSLSEQDFQTVVAAIREIAG